MEAVRRGGTRSEALGKVVEASSEVPVSGELDETKPVRLPARPASPAKSLPVVIEAKKIERLQNVQAQHAKTMPQSGRLSALHFINQKKEDSILNAAINAALASFVSSPIARSSPKASASSKGEKVQPFIKATPAPKIEKKLGIDEIFPTLSPLKAGEKPNLHSNKSIATGPKTQIGGRENNPATENKNVNSRVNPRTGEVEELRFNNGPWTWEKKRAPPPTLPEALCRNCDVLFESRSALHKHLQESLAGPQHPDALKQPDSHFSQYLELSGKNDWKR